MVWFLQTSFSKIVSFPLKVEDRAASPEHVLKNTLFDFVVLSASDPHGIGVLAIDNRCDNGRFPASTSSLSIANPALTPSTENGGNPVSWHEDIDLKIALKCESDQRQKAIDCIYNFIQQRPEDMRPQSLVYKLEKRKG
jgi:hypothetical protein